MPLKLTLKREPERQKERQHEADQQRAGQEEAGERKQEAGSRGTGVCGWLKLGGGFWRVWRPMEAKKTVQTATGTDDERQRSGGAGDGAERIITSYHY